MEEPPKLDSEYSDLEDLFFVVSRWSIFFGKLGIWRKTGIHAYEGPELREVLHMRWMALQQVTA